MDVLPPTMMAIIDKSTTNVHSPCVRAPSSGNLFGGQLRPRV